MNLNEMFKAKATAKGKAEAILNAALSAGRSMNADEEKQYDALVAEIQSLEATIEKANALSAIKSDSFGHNLNVAPAATKSADFRATEDYAKGFNAYICKGQIGVVPFAASMTEGVNGDGGYLVPTSYNSAIIEKLNQNNVMRQIATVMPLNSKVALPVDGTLPTATWTGEGDAYTATKPTVAQKILTPNKLAAIVTISEELLSDSVIDLQAYVSGKLGVAFANAEEDAFFTGDGSAKPTGVLGDITNVIDAAGAAAITSDEVIDVYHKVPAQYRRNASWVVKDSTALILRKLKNGTTGDYMWQPGLQAGQPDMLLGRPVYTSEAMPAATTGLDSVVFGDFSYYLIGDFGQRAFQRLNEAYAANGLVGFRAYERVDGVLSNPDAFAKLTQA